MEETHHAASTLALWLPAVKALVQSAGLFPGGSFVKLSTGENAQVVQAHTEQLDRPVVHLLDNAGNPTDKLVASPASPSSPSPSSEPSPRPRDDHTQRAAAGRWPLAAGCWPLATGHWPREAGGGVSGCAPR